MAFIEPMHRNKPNITYLLTAWWQAITWTNKNLMSIEPETNFGEISMKIALIYL